MSEKWEEIYTEQQLEKLQTIECEMLYVFDEVCEKMDLTYVLYGGTLLGAYKFQGFIPWDDDIDVAMLRKDYEKFVAYAQNYLSSEYVIQTPYNENKTPFPYCKMRLKGTKYIEKYNHLLDIEQGVYIDIYPIDDVPDDEKLRSIQFKRIQRLLKIYYLKQCLHVDRDTPFNSKTKHLLAYYLFKFIPHSTLVDIIDKTLKKYNDKGYKRKGCLYSPKYENVYNDFYPLERVVFNGKLFNAPGDYIAHLKRRYGNIDELPSAHERIGHRPYVFDIGC